VIPDAATVGSCIEVGTGGIYRQGVDKGAGEAGIEGRPAAAAIAGDIDPGLRSHIHFVGVGGIDGQGFTHVVARSDIDPAAAVDALQNATISDGIYGVAL